MENNGQVTHIRRLTNEWNYRLWDTRPRPEQRLVISGNIDYIYRGSHARIRRGPCEDVTDRTTTALRNTQTWTQSEFPFGTEEKYRENECLKNRKVSLKSPVTSSVNKQGSKE